MLISLLVVSAVMSKPRLSVFFIFSLTSSLLVERSYRPVLQLSMETSIGSLEVRSETVFALRSPDMGSLDVDAETSSAETLAKVIGSLDVNREIFLAETSCHSSRSWSSRPLSVSAFRRKGRRRCQRRYCPDSPPLPSACFHIP